MGRFDREDVSAEGLPASLDTATEELRSTVERQIREIMQAAEERAARIEDRALEQAGQIEQYSQRTARSLLAGSIERTDRMLAAIESFERELELAVHKLRNEAETLAAELHAAKPDELPEPEEANGYSDEAEAVAAIEGGEAPDEAQLVAEEQKPSSSRRRRLRRRRAKQQQAE